MEKKKKLLINTDPAVRTYTFHGFFHAITAAKDKVDTLAAEISVEKFEDYVWNQQTDRLECCYDGQDGRIRFLSNQWNIGMNHCFWRKCDKEDRIEIEIHKQLFSGSRGAINLFIADGSFQDMTDEEHRGTLRRRMYGQAREYRSFQQIPIASILQEHSFFPVFLL